MERLGELHIKEFHSDQKFPYELYFGSRDGVLPAGKGNQHLHWHEALQFTLVTDGEMTMQVNGHDHHLKAGEAIFINYGLLHVAHDFSEDCSYVSLNFPDKLISFFPDSRMEEQYVLPYTSNYALPVTILSPDCAWQKEIIDLILELKGILRDTGAFGWEYLASVKTVQMWYILISNISQTAERVSESALYKQERMRKMIAYIHANYAEDIRVEDISQAAGVSAGECYRSFKNMLHTSPKDYLNQYRLDKSVELLDETDLSVTEVANQTGYNFTSHFISSFKSKFGETPGQYRQR